MGNLTCNPRSPFKAFSVFKTAQLVSSPLDSTLPLSPHAMSALPKLCLALVSLLSLALLALLAELLYLLHFLRRAPSADPELGRSPPGRTRRAFLFLVAPFFKHRSRVEPATADHASPKPPLPPPNAAAEEEEEEEEEQEFAQWQEMRSGPSRSLYSIAEEAEEGHDDDAEGEEKEDTPFATPCTSPEFYSPLPSPPRAAESAAEEV